METYFLPALITALITLLFLFIRNGFNTLTKTDERLEGKVDKISDKIDETRGAVIEIQDGFRTLGYPMQRILKTTSPVTLTDYGKKLVAESGFNKIFDDNRETIIGWIKELNPTNQYDAQEFSRKALLDRKDDTLFEPLKNYAFQHGETSLEQILRAGSIVLRDEAIKELNLK
ncbi:hypothetical protein KJ636_01040 [Patescibacteria group bacterium]|nr:hypothetical protein [Patescibacteria group bacterium]MBU4481460.1 hypothetical protein [Patescibacteria group bacterium]